MRCFCHFCPCQEVCPFPTEEDIRRGNKKRDLDVLRRNCVKEEIFTVTERWEGEMWRLCKVFDYAVINKTRIRDCRSKRSHRCNVKAN